jgi:predicted deacetylase
MDVIKRKIKLGILNILNLPIPFSLIDDNEYTININIVSLESILKSSDKIFCNINFDDQCPVYGQVKKRDFGGNVNGGITEKLKQFLDNNPNVAITSFVIPNFLGNTRNFNNRFLLSNFEYSSWIKYYSDLSNQYNIEFALHGLYHFQKENPFFQSYTEFAFKKGIEAMKCILEGIKVFKKVGWNITGFRQPGWDLSTEIDLPKIAKEVGLKYIASNSYNAGFNAGGIERVSNYYPTFIDGIINFPQNIELDWPIENIYAKIEELIAVKAFISIKGHFVDKKSINCLNGKNLIKLQKVIDYLRNNYNYIKFITLSDFSNKLDIMKNGEL